MIGHAVQRHCPSCGAGHVLWDDGDGLPFSFPSVTVELRLCACLTDAELIAHYMKERDEIEQYKAAREAHQ